MSSGGRAVVGAPARPEVEVELFGVPRRLAGERSLRVAGRTLGEAAAAPAALVRPGSLTGLDFDFGPDYAAWVPGMTTIAAGPAAGRRSERPGCRGLGGAGGVGGGRGLTRRSVVLGAAGAATVGSIGYEGGG